MVQLGSLDLLGRVGQSPS